MALLISRIYSCSGQILRSGFVSSRYSWDNRLLGVNINKNNSENYERKQIKKEKHLEKIKKSKNEKGNK